MDFSVPEQVVEIINALQAHTYEAYLVGDCVRGLLMGEKPLDFDIVTNAEMNRLLAIFEDKYKVNTDYADKGELIIINGAMGISVSPYRSRMASDGKPVYCGTLEEDLRRRVYRANAVAYSLADGIVDPFDGLPDACGDSVLLNLIRYTPNPEASSRRSRRNRAAANIFGFNPDSVFEAVRRCATENTDISPYALEQVCENAEIIFDMEKEKFHSEFRSMLMGRRITDALMVFRPVVFAIFPKLAETDGFDQHSAVQEYSLYEHTARAVGYAVPEYSVRLALLFHGVGKVDCMSDRGTYYSYDGHAERGAMLTRQILTDLDFPAELVRQVVFLVLHHDDDINAGNYTAYTAEYGAENVRLLLLMRAADVRAKRSDRRYEQCSQDLRALADEVTRGRNETARRNSVTFSDLKKLAESLKL